MDLQQQSTELIDQLSKEETRLVARLGAVQKALQSLRDLQSSEVKPPQHSLQLRGAVVALFDKSLGQYYYLRDVVNQLEGMREQGYLHSKSTGTAFLTMVAHTLHILCKSGFLTRSEVGGWRYRKRVLEARHE